MLSFFDSSAFLVLLPVSLMLVWVFWAATKSLFASLRQAKRLDGTKLGSMKLKDSQLATTLGQTLTDLSVRRRPAQWFDVDIVRVDRESEDVKSFYLVDRSGESLPPFLAGQHLLIEMPAATGRTKQCRCYTLSDACHNGYWRISVKRNSDSPQSVSRWLHDDLEKGDSVRVRGPSGSFHLQSTTNRHVVLASAGIGITPMLPMLRETLRRPHGSLTLFAQFRDVDHMPFAESLLSIANQFTNVRMKLFLSRFPRGVTGDPNGLIQEGKFRPSDLCVDLPDPEITDCYLCGPQAWQSTMREGLLSEGIPDNQIYFELFQEEQISSSPVARTSDESCSVHFRQSNKLTAFAATYPNLLGFAMKSDVMIDSGCRTGACGSCVIKLLQGKVKYIRRPQFPLKPNEILPCVCVPDGDIVVDA
jgi:uncharacterized protein